MENGHKNNFVYNIAKIIEVKQLLGFSSIEMQNTPQTMALFNINKVFKINFFQQHLCTSVQF